MFDLSYPATITLSSSVLSINSNITITGPGAENLTIDANGLDECFTSYSVLNITGIGFTGATYTGIWTNGTLTLRECNVFDNYSPGNGGGIRTGNSAGTLKLYDCKFYDNTANSSGGAIYPTGGSHTISGCEIYSNETDYQDRAAIYIGYYNGPAYVTIEDCVIDVNHAARWAGGIYAYACEAEIINTEITNNTALAWGGGLVCNTGTVELDRVHMDGYQGADKNYFFETSDGDLTLKEGSYFSIGDDDLSMSDFNLLDPPTSSFLYTKGDGRLVGTTSREITFQMGIPGAGPRPVIIDAPAGNTFAVSIRSYFPSPARVYWDIVQTGGSDMPYSYCFVYEKNDVPTGQNVEDESYVYHFYESNWQNKTTLGAFTETWGENSDFWITFYDFEEFQPGSPWTVFSSGPIPTLTGWAAIALGSLLLIAGGWFVWKRIV